MIMIPLRDVPRRERRLLYCTDPEVLPSRRPFEHLDLLEAINRSLSGHGESVDLIWPAEPSGQDSPDEPIGLIQRSQANGHFRSQTNDHFVPGA